MKQDLQTELIAQMNECYKAAFRAGKCGTQDEFADLVNIPRRTMQDALSSRVSEKTISKTRAALEKLGVISPATPVQIGGESSIMQQQSPHAHANMQGVPAATHERVVADIRASVECLVSEMRAQREFYAQLFPITDKQLTTSHAPAANIPTAKA